MTVAVATDFLYACELHDADGITAALAAGLDPNAPLDGKTPVTWLLEMYTRSDAFPACLRTLLDRGATLEPGVLVAVLLNDTAAIERAVRADPASLLHRSTLPSAFTPLDDVTLLHVAAEWGHLAAARVLVDSGADVNARAGVDADGLGGQTPIFHTVNAHANRSAPVMQLLLDAGADATARVAGLTWGRGHEWETTFFDLTPIAYAQLGTLPQMHRDERQITENVRALLAAAGRPVPPLSNVPNRYVARSRAR
jgi:ankyrin repeat protein